MSLTVEKICRRAMQLAGRGDKPSVNDFNDALETLNMVFQNWSVNYGVALWDIICNEFSFTAGELTSNNGKIYQCKKGHVSSTDNEPGIGTDWANYWVETFNLTTTNIWVSGLYYNPNRSIDFGSPDIHSVSNLYIDYNGVFYPVDRVNKDSFIEEEAQEIGRPTKAYIQKNAIGFTVILSPIPDDDYTFKYYACKKPMEFSEGQLSGGVGLPSNWLMAAQYALAVELAYLYSIDKESIAVLIQKARFEFKKCLGTDKEEVDRCFVKPTY